MTQNMYVRFQTKRKKNKKLRLMAMVRLFVQCTWHGQNVNSHENLQNQYKTSKKARRNAQNTQSL